VILRSFVHVNGDGLSVIQSNRPPGAETVRRFVPTSDFQRHLDSDEIAAVPRAVCSQTHNPDGAGRRRDAGMTTEEMS
jgi:hypothetical protein